jgi:hypothetical protein
MRFQLVKFRLTKLSSALSDSARYLKSGAVTAVALQQAAGGAMTVTR